MSRRQNDFIDNRADVGSEDEEEEEVDEETGEPIEKSPKAKTDKKKKSGPEYDDSSEEEDDDDEEAMKAVCRTEDSISLLHHTNYPLGQRRLHCRRR